MINYFKKVLFWFIIYMLFYTLIDFTLDTGIKWISNTTLAFLGGLLMALVVSTKPTRTQLISYNIKNLGDDGRSIYELHYLRSYFYRFIVVKKVKDFTIASRYRNGIYIYILLGP